MIIGTAGHIDHGKTTLVRALTGVDTDRLKEEKARGISIELGYAYQTLNDADVLGFVDVPGHERLVHTMVAGACGIDFALLVIAADDGVMPQTREHVAILQLFGVTRGAVALTKVDRVGAERVEAAEAEVRAFLQPTAFRSVPIFRINAAAEGDVGVRVLKEYLKSVAMAARGDGAREGRLFRLAIDRVFTLPGQGTVVAGTVFSGSVCVGDKVCVLPSNTTVRVRSIHSQNRPAEVGRAGQRCALTLSGIEKDDVRRGDWLADPRVGAPTTRIDVLLECVPDSGVQVKSWMPVHFHHGARHVTAHVVPLDSPVSRAQIALDASVCALPGDRFIIRDTQAAHTLGGGIVLDPNAPSRKRRSAERLSYLHALERMIGGEGPGPLLAQAPWGIKQSELIHLTGQALPQLPDGTQTVDCGGGRQYVVLSSAWHALRDRAIETLRQFHLESPDQPGPDVGRLRRITLPQLPEDVWHALIDELTSAHEILRNGPWLHLPGHTVSLSEAQETLARRLQPLIAEGRFDPPWVRDLASTVQVPEDNVRQVLRMQVTRGFVCQVVRDLFYDRQCIDELATVLARIAQDHGRVEAAQYRDAVGLGRKRTIQILEFFDRVGLTRRVRDSHVLRPDSGWQVTRPTDSHTL